MFSSSKVLSYLAGLQAWVSTVLLILLFPHMPPSLLFLQLLKALTQSFSLQTVLQFFSERQSALKGANAGARSHSQKHPRKMANQTAQCMFN